MNTQFFRILKRHEENIGSPIVGSYLFVPWPLYTRRQLLLWALAPIFVGILVIVHTFYGRSGNRSIAANTQQTAPPYTVIDMGVQRGYTDSAGLAINNLGQSIGRFYKHNWSGYRVTFFIATPEGKTTDIGYAGKSAGIFYSINDAGQAVGYCYDDERSAFIWQNGDYNRLTFKRRSEAHSINNRQQVVGSIWDNDALEHATLWQDGHAIDISQGLPGNSLGVGINDNGDVIIRCTARGSESVRSFFWNKGKLQEVPSLGGDITHVTAINNRGWVVGRGNLRAGSTKLAGFLWQPGQKPLLLGSLGGDWITPTSINTARIVVGSATDKKEESHGFLWQDGHMQDLNELVPKSTKLNLYYPAGINERGDIVGTGRIGPISHGKYRAFLLKRTK